MPADATVSELIKTANVPAATATERHWIDAKPILKREPKGHVPTTAAPSVQDERPPADIGIVAGEDQNLDLGNAGGGARREHERRRERREAKTREEHPHIGGLLLRLKAAPNSEKAWESGAVGEDAVAAHLARRCPGVVILHDRRMPGSRANIDHIAIGPSGLLVIDAKRYKGKIEVRKLFLGDAKLVIAGRDRSKLVEGLKRQVDAVRAALAIVEQDVAVDGCFCFVNPAGQAGGSGLPMLRTLAIDGFPLYYPRKLSKRLNRPGPLGASEVAVLAETLIELLPAA